MEYDYYFNTVKNNKVIILITKPYEINSISLTLKKKKIIFDSFNV